jgi:hypothetical protein
MQHPFLPMGNKSEAFAACVTCQGLDEHHACAQLKKEERGGGGVVSRLTGSLQSWMMSFIQAHGFGGILLLVRLRTGKKGFGCRHAQARGCCPASDCEHAYPCIP